MRSLLSILGLLILGTNLFAQEQKMKDASSIAKAMERFNTLGSVLYLAAHPDDENTRLISYFANDKNYRTAYLSLTRGDGGQNLIGYEKGALLGLIRTQELLEARKRDGGEQYFTRAVDFGYSKNAEETFTKWDRDAVLADVVFVIRKYRPDVIVTRFNPVGYNGHGHHSASALLAMEAFDLAGKKEAYPEQLKHVELWQPKRLYFNSSSWWDKELPEKAANNPDYLVMDVGKYDPSLGKWINEIAAESRSQHKSQGFGVSTWRGEMLEYLQYLKGDKADGDLFSGIKTDWNRVQGAGSIKLRMEEIIFKFDHKNPQASLKDLLKLRKTLIEDVKDETWKEVKLKELDDIILSCSGIWIDAFSNRATITAGSTFQLGLDVMNSLGADFELLSVRCAQKDSTVNQKISDSKVYELRMAVKNKKQQASQPYWLREPYNAMFKVDSYELLGKAENDPVYKVKLQVKLEGQEMTITRRVNYKWTTRVEGQRYKDFRVVPDFSINTNQELQIFSGNTPKTVTVKVKAHKGGVSGILKAKVPNAWKVEPAQYEVSFVQEGESDYSFKVTPPFVAQSGELSFGLVSGEKRYDKGYRLIDYDHIREQMFLPEAKLKLIRLDVLHRIRKIGYIDGAGDEIPESLERLGVLVEHLNLSEIGVMDLSQYDAIIMGVRAYNTEEKLKYVNKLLLDYVYEGGNLVVQYNTNRELVMEDFGPEAFRISRDRVTVEEAKAEFLLPEHPIFNSPNKITQEDFKGWVQERGLYFADEWDEQFQALISWNDPGEDQKKGALITCPHGKGNFIYTGISFFRQLPAGVPGAYRLFANIISYRR